MMGYYDIVLGLIPLSLAGLTGLLVLAGVSLTFAVPLASIVAIGLMGHAMFVNAPVSTPPKAAQEYQTPSGNSQPGFGTTE